MGTSSNINVKVQDKYHSVYCNYDGYPEGVGKMLVENYNTQELAETLVSHGSISYVDMYCDKPDGHSYDTPAKNRTVYYGRDRGEDDTEMQVLDEPEQNESYSYVWDGTQWLIHGVEYDEDDNEIEWNGVPLIKVLNDKEKQNG